MKGTINYLTKLQRICSKYNGQCKNCPLGKGEHVLDTHCPRLLQPMLYSNERINRYVRAVEQID